MKEAREDYRRRIDVLTSDAATALIDCGVSEASVDFAAVHKRGRRPGDANSEFLGNRAMGDWAETTLKAGINAANAGVKAVSYGSNDRIIAGDERFADFYEAYQDELANIGKRPDLLLIPDTLALQTPALDLTELDSDALQPFLDAAVAGIEVRSSKFFALKYAEVRRQELELNPKSKVRECQSITPKVEDLRLVKRWIDRYGIPHYYAQVFFDSVYVISFERILTIIAHEPEQFEVEVNKRNQDKPTIHIPVTAAQLISRFPSEPEFAPRWRETRLHRVDAYVVPVGCSAPVSVADLNTVFGIPQH